MSKLPLLGMGLAAMIAYSPALAQDDQDSIDTTVTDQTTEEKKPYSVEVTQAPENGQIYEPALNFLRSNMGMYINTETAEITIKGQGEGVVNISAYRLDNGGYVHNDCLFYEAKVPEGEWTLTYNWDLTEFTNECFGDIRFKAYHKHDPSSAQEDTFKISTPVFQRNIEPVEPETHRKRGKRPGRNKRNR